MLNTIARAFTCWSFTKHMFSTIILYLKKIPVFYIHTTKKIISLEEDIQSELQSHIYLGNQYLISLRQSCILHLCSKIGRFIYNGFNFVYC